MARYSVETKLDPEEVIGKAVSYFGAGGLGLEAVEGNPCCVSFEGGGGHITVTATQGEKSTLVELETREWDHQVQQFMRKLA